MSEKIVSLQVSDKDEKLLLGGKTRRRKNRKDDEGTEVLKVNIVSPTEQRNTPVTIVKDVLPIVEKSNQQNQQHQQNQQNQQNQTTIVSNKVSEPEPKHGGAVKLINKKTAPTPKVVSTTPKLVMMKKKHPMIHTTIKKPKIIINSNTEKVQEVPKVKRRFTERKIALHIKPLSQTRKNRKILKDKIMKMPIALIRKQLTSKGLLKQKSVVSDEIARNMLYDFMILHELD